MPDYEDIDWRGLKFSKEQFRQVMSLDRDERLHELALHDDLFFKLYDRLPREFPAIRDFMLASLWRSRSKV